MKADAIIVAAGSGSRFGSVKQFAMLDGLPLYQHSLKIFAAHPLIDRIVLVISADDVTRIEKEIWPQFYGKRIEITIGGATRQDSVSNGMQKFEELGAGESVLIHDAARPFITTDLISKVVHAISEHGAALTAIPVVDTLKRAADGFAKETVSRKDLCRAQTPQGARFTLLKQALEAAHNVGYSATDESELLERIEVKPFIVIGDESNRKITFSEDMKK